MNQRRALSILSSAVLAAWSSIAPAQSQALRATSPEMAAAEQYLSANPEDEIALARSAAPPSISADAQVLVLGSHGYEKAVNGKNGFVCFVQRSWAAGFDDPAFWNPKIRGPNCFNPSAVRTELPQNLKRTEWVLAGATKQQLIDKTKAAFADPTFKAPEAGAFSFSYPGMVTLATTLGVHGSPMSCSSSRMARPPIGAPTRKALPSWDKMAAL